SLRTGALALGRCAGRSISCPPSTSSLFEASAASATAVKPTNMSEVGPAPIPRATYRLQFHKQFAFPDAAALAPYLTNLGLRHVCGSPYLKARSGSKHGYDIVGHGQFNPELGDTPAFDEMVTAFRDNGLGHILDFVPNHIGVGGADNPWWLDVLEWGPQ